jgi:hypothetical protein
MSIKKRLHKKAKDSQRQLKELEGRTTGAAANWESIVTEYCETIEEQAATGEEKHFFDMRDFNQATITKVSMVLKERLGDVLVIVSPRGIEADWEVQD